MTCRCGHLWLLHDPGHRRQLPTCASEGCPCVGYREEPGVLDYRSTEQSALRTPGHDAVTSENSAPKPRD